MVDKDTKVADMFADLEKDATPESGPESANQPHLGGKPQKPEPELKTSDVQGNKKPARKAKKATSVPEEKEITDLSEGTAAPESNFGEMEFHTITLDPRNLRFIPGPKKKRLLVLKVWCKEHCAGDWKPLPNGLTWLFKVEEDSIQFNQAWNSRTLQTDEDVTDGAFYE